MTPPSSLSAARLSAELPVPEPAEVVVLPIGDADDEGERQPLLGKTPIIQTANREVLGLSFMVRHSEYCSKILNSSGYFYDRPSQPSSSLSCLFLSNLPAIHSLPLKSSSFVPLYNLCWACAVVYTWGYHLGAQVH